MVGVDAQWRSDLAQWRSDLAEADLRVAALERARDAARAEADTIGRIVRSMESLERRRSKQPESEMPA